MSLLLCVYAGCSPRCAAKAIEVFNFMLKGIFKEAPASTTIRTWLAKAGVDSLTHKKRSLDEAYALITDGSITIGDQQLMMTVKVPADHKGKALNHVNAEVVSLQVESNWPAEKVKEHLETVIEDEGHKPEYSISDNGHNLKKAFGLMEFPHHRDISHTFAVYLKKVYSEDVEYCQFMQLIGKTKHLALSNMAYLMPSKQRFMARFMNMYSTVDWSCKVLENYRTFSQKEKFYFSFIPRNASFVEELGEVTSVFERVMSLCKNSGFSKESADTCRAIIRNGLSDGNSRQLQLKQMLLGYINQESALLTKEHPIHNISTDIIESKFGTHKAKMSTCKTAGFTESVLMLPLSGKFGTLESVRENNVVSIMETTTVGMVKDWKSTHLKEDPMVMRRRKLSA
jgi:hypothetical protein